MSEINFIPESFIRARARARMMLRSALLLACVAAAMGIWFVLFNSQSHAELDDYLANLDAQIVTIMEQNREQSTRRMEHRRLSDEIELRARLRTPLPMTYVLRAIVETMPGSVGLRSVSIFGDPVSSPAQTRRKRASKSLPRPLPPLRVLIEGLAPDDVTIAKIVGGLDKRPAFERVELGFSRPVEGGDLVAREFQITARIPLDRTYVLEHEGGAADAR